jgi:anti-sigma factor (TIGR02949 family)
MDCRELDNLLYPYLDGELVDGDRVQVDSHLAGCEECRKRTDQEHAMLLFVRSRAKQQSAAAPEGLRARLSDQLHQEQRKSNLRTVGKLTAAAAGLAVCTLAAHHGYRIYQYRLYVEDAASRHARAYPLEVQKPSPEQVSAWFDGKLDHHVRVPSIPNAVVQGVRLLNVRDRQAGYIRFIDTKNRNMGLFVYGDKADDVDVDGTEVRNSNGYNVVTWRDGDVVYQLVTDLDEQDIRQMLPQRQGATGLQIAAPQAPIPTVVPASYAPAAGPLQH